MHTAILEMIAVPFSPTAPRATALERMQAALAGRPVFRAPGAPHNFLMSGRYAGLHGLGHWLTVIAAIAALESARDSSALATEVSFLVPANLDCRLVGENGRVVLTQRIRPREEPMFHHEAHQEHEGAESGNNPFVTFVVRPLGCGRTPGLR